MEPRLYVWAVELNFSSTRWTDRQRPSEQAEIEIPKTTNDYDDIYETDLKEQARLVMLL